MRLIEQLQELIDEEVCDVKKYAKLAAEVKADRPALAQVLYTISTQEDSHQAAIHAEVVKIIQEHRKTKGEPPAAMLAVYDYQHRKSIDKLAEARKYQDVYKNG